VKKSDGPQTVRNKEATGVEALGTRTLGMGRLAWLGKTQMRETVLFKLEEGGERVGSRKAAILQEEGGGSQIE